MLYLARKAGTEFLVNTVTENSQDGQSITALTNGNFVVIWNDFSRPVNLSPSAYFSPYEASIRAQFFGESGNRIGDEFLLGSRVTFGQANTSVASLRDGGFVVSWADDGSPLYSGILINGIIMSIYDANGVVTRSELRIARPSVKGEMSAPTTTGLEDGTFVVSWADLRSAEYGYRSGITTTRFDGTGWPISGYGTADANSLGGGEYASTVTGLANGGYVVSWESRSDIPGDGSGSSINAQLLNVNGVRIGSNFLVNTEVSGDQQDPAIARLKGGGFVVSWLDHSNTLGDTSGTSIKAQVFDASGQKIGTEVLVNTQTGGDQSDPTVAGLSTGGFAVSWTDTSGTLGDGSGSGSGSGIKAQVFDASGRKVGAEFLVNTQTGGDQFHPQIAGLMNGRFAVSWTDSSLTLGDSSGTSIKAQVFEPGFTDGAPVYHHDFNGDGKADLLWRGQGGEVGLWQMAGSQVLAGDGVGNPGNYWSVAGTEDFNGDGRADVLWRGLGGEVGLWQMDGSRVVAGGGVSNPGAYWAVAGTGDFDGDGKADILWRGQGGEVGLWQMNGLSIVAGGGVSNPGTYWTVVGTDDFNGDGRADVLWRGEAGEVGLWVMDGARFIGDGVASPGTYWTVAGTGDFNGDGRADILWRGGAGEVGIWLMDGFRSIGGDGVSDPGDGWTVAGTGDFNADGRADVLFHGRAGEVGLWEMNGLRVAAGGGVGNPGDYWQIAG